MRNIWKTKKNHFSSIEVVATIIFFIVITVWLNIEINSVNISSSEEQLNETKASIEKAVVLCYSIEGYFPPDINYLKENYGLTFDENLYILNYNAFSSNIMPEIVLLRRN